MATAEQKEDLKDDDLKDITIVIEGEGERVDPPAKKEGADEEKKDDDKDRRAKDKGADDEGEQESADLTDEEREALREKRRKENALRRQRAKDREEARERELAELRRTVQDLSQRQHQNERKATEGDMNRIAAGIEDSMRQMEEAKGLIAKAATEANGQALAEAQEAYYEARQRAEYLSRLKHGIVAREKEERQAPKVDPAVAQHARKWMSKNPWYDPKSGDEDSMIALAVDDALAKKGYDPRTPEYWEEFEKRVAARLPHRVTKDTKTDDLDEDLDERGSQTSGSGRERAPAGGKTFRISAARVAALREAGVDINDKKEMAKYVKRFMDYDRQQAQKGGK